MTTATTKWLRANHDTVGGVVKVAAGAAAVAVGVGTAAVAVGEAGHVLHGIGHAAGAAAGLLGAVVNPITLIGGALAAGVYAWVEYTDSGKAAAADIARVAGDIFETVKETIGGISDAIAAGDLALAGKVAFAGLKVAALGGILGISEAVGGVWGNFIGKLGAQIAGGDFAGAWTTTVKGMAAIWDGFTGGIVDLFVSAAKKVTEIWRNTVNGITDFLLRKAAQGGVIGTIISKVLGVDVKAETAKTLLQKNAQVDVLNRA